MKYAQIDPAKQTKHQVIGWFDTDFAKYTQDFTQADFISVSDTDWNSRTSTPYYDPATKKFSSAPPPPTLSEAQQTQIAALTTQCRQTIVGGYSSDALGATHTYPSTPTDQANMVASVTASLLPNLPSGWTTLFWCADATGAWAFTAHTAAQIQQAGSDGKTFVQSQQQKLQGLVDQVNKATTVADVQAITW